MSEFEQWQQANDAYLANAIADVRPRLETLAETMTRASAAPPIETRAEQPQRSSWTQRRFGKKSKTSTQQIGGLLASSTSQQDEVAPSAQALAASPVQSQSDHMTPALLLLAQRLQLSDFERNVLLLCAAMEFDTRMPAMCARAQGDASKPYPTFSLAMRLFDGGAWDAMSPERPLRYWRLIEINQPGVQPLIGAALKADERIVNYLKGVNYLDDRLAPLLQFLAAGESDLPPSQEQAAQTIGARLRSTAENAAAPLILLRGNDGASQTQLAQHVATELGLHLYRLDADAMPTALADQETFLRLWQREVALLNVALFIDVSDIDRASSQGIVVQRVLNRVRGICFVAAREPLTNLDRDVFPVECAKPTPLEQKAAWAVALGEDGAQHAARPATHFNFNLATIRQVTGEVLALSTNDRSQLPQMLWQHSLAQAQPILGQLAQRVDVKATWDDLKLPSAEKALLRQIADQAEQRGVVYDDWGFRDRMNRGLGISALFAGSSGTGKTMAAEVIANALQLPLYRVDLSSVVNKYIGETEKNLRRLFDAAEGGGAILLCDEADALFGKRSEVNDSHDRNANIEINYLLQRIESFSGIAILTTNMKSALDSAFLRRLRFIVDFPFPALAERAAIWRGAFPNTLDVGALDFEQLARFNLSGGSIQNAVLNAAFLAAKSRMPIAMSLVLDAVRAEFKKLDKPVNEAEFRRLQSVGDAA